MRFTSAIQSNQLISFLNRRFFFSRYLLLLLLQFPRWYIDYDDLSVCRFCYQLRELTLWKFQLRISILKRCQISSPVFKEDLNLSINFLSIKILKNSRVKNRIQKSIYLSINITKIHLIDKSWVKLTHKN